MKIKTTFINGTISGLVMGICLFVGGAVTARIIYGPQFVPPGKFEPEQINAFYFFWTKLVIGWIFGLLFTLVYEMLPLSKKMTGVLQGLTYGFIFWLVISLWSISHPLVYGTINVKDQVFWEIYELFGFLGFGATLGIIYKRPAGNPANHGGLNLNR
jgi:hypothetical protein